MALCSLVSAFVCALSFISSVLIFQNDVLSCGYLLFICFAWLTSLEICFTSVNAQNERGHYYPHLSDVEKGFQVSCGMYPGPNSRKNIVNFEPWSSSTYSSTLFFYITTSSYILSPTCWPLTMVLFVSWGFLWSINCNNYVILLS